MTRWLKYLFNIWPFRTIRICPILQIICQSRLKICPILNKRSNKLPKTLHFLSKWQNFAKSGHTGRRVVQNGRKMSERKKELGREKSQDQQTDKNEAKLGTHERIYFKYLLNDKERRDKRINGDTEGKQCDQIGQFIGLWATLQSIWQQLICPNLPHS